MLRTFTAGAIWNCCHSRLPLLPRGGGLCFTKKLKRAPLAQDLTSPAAFRRRLWGQERMRAGLKHEIASRTSVLTKKRLWCEAVILACLGALCTLGQAWGSLDPLPVSYLASLPSFRMLHASPALGYTRLDHLRISCSLSAHLLTCLSVRSTPE